MAITIGNTSGGPVGPGIIVFVSGMAGPTANDDYVVAEINDGGTSNILVSGSAVTHGATSVLVVPGIRDGGPAFNPAIVGLAPGAAVTLAVEQFHHNGTSVASTTGFFTWDPVSGLWYVVQKVVSPDSGPIADILAAVQKIFVNAP